MDVASGRPDGMPLLRAGNQLTPRFKAALERAGIHAVYIKDEATEGNSEIAGHAERLIPIPRTDWMLQPMLAVIPLQLLAYRIARHRDLNVDQPRNLAKTVTVE